LFFVWGWLVYCFRIWFGLGEWIADDWVRPGVVSSACDLGVLVPWSYPVAAAAAILKY
jgi:hypothetical protein